MASGMGSHAAAGDVGSGLEGRKARSWAADVRMEEWYVAAAAAVSGREGRDVIMASMEEEELGLACVGWDDGWMLLVLGAILVVGLG